MENRFLTTFSSPFDTFTIVWKEIGSDLLIQRIFLSDPELKSEVKALESFKHIKLESSPSVELLGERIQRFLRGEHVSFKLELLDFNKCYEVQKRVLTAEYGIPRGWVSACVSGTIDMIAAAMTYTPSRATVLAPSITYINVSQAVVVKNASGLQISSLDNLTAFIVGIQAGTTQYDELTAIPGFTEGVNLLVYPNADTLMINLDNGVIDAAYVEKPIFTVWSKVYSLKIIFSTVSDSLVLWCRWEEPELQYVINKVIFEAYQTGTIYDLMMTWFG